ncbi:putative kinetochore protein NUF2 [Candida viswanathii]|uniref:Putative kinetochore protein NUF2 n=1 Tax=Candida viswanathii TaxID=5486 RepID=A0A367YIK3_9ASCO|nr:putative kinetochore protein NUF2 [Candida viswanathii]
MSRLSAINDITNGTRQLRLRKDLFPLLDATEITICLQECGFNVTQEQIIKPSQDFVMNLYEEFIDTFMGVKFGVIREKARSMALARRIHSVSVNGNDAGNEEGEGEGEGDPESDDKTGDIYPALPITLLLRYISRFLHVCGINDFTLVDLGRPDGFRTRRVLSAVINYIRFREDHSVVFEDLANEAETTVKKVEDAQAENANILRRINEAKEKLEVDPETGEERAHLLHVNSYNRKLENKLRELKTVQEKLTKEHDDYKQEKATLAQKLYDLNYLYNETQESVDSLTKYSETDLSVLEQIIQDLNADLSSMQTSLTNLEKGHQNMGITIDSIQANEISLKDVLKLAEDVLKNIEKELIELKILRDNQSALDELSRKQIELQGQILIVQNQLNKLNKKYQDLINQAAKKEAAISQVLEHAKLEYDKIVPEKEKHKEVHKQLMDQILKVQQEGMELEDNFAKETTELELKLGTLRNIVKRYITELNKNLK